MRVRWTAVGHHRLRALLVSVAGIAAWVACAGAARDAGGAAGVTLTIRGQRQSLHTYGSRGGDPVIVSSGDGGWVHVAPHVAELLAAHGCFVVGFDVKSYLAGFTTSASTLREEDVPGDYAQLVALAASGAAHKPVLVGVSEGAGLSVLAASDSRLHATAAGVIAIGLPAVNELGWRWRDSVIYLTHGTPNEPLFSTAPLVGKIAPLPFAALHSTSDEFLPLEDARRLVGRAGDPKRFWAITASDHRFSDNLVELDARLLEAMGWVRDPMAR